MRFCFPTSDLFVRQTGFLRFLKQIRGRLDKFPWVVPIIRVDRGQIGTVADIVRAGTKGDILVHVYILGDLLEPKIEIVGGQFKVGRLLPEYSVRHLIHWHFIQLTTE